MQFLTTGFFEFDTTTQRRLMIPRCLLAILAVTSSAASYSQEDISFDRQVRPILSTHCFPCHGPDKDKRESGLRLDERNSAIDSEAIVPGDADASQLIQRINSLDPDTVMPPDADRKLTRDEKEVLRKWISQGAIYEKHWAFEKPVSPPVPETENDDWSNHPIDAFVLARLKQYGWTPNPEADRYALVRRIYLDLIGIPPTVQQADMFVRSDDPMAYEKLVDQLLASPRYGERWGAAVAGLGQVFRHKWLRKRP